MLEIGNPYYIGDRRGIWQLVPGEPKLGFVCHWCSDAGADLAWASCRKYPANIRVVRVPCWGRVDRQFIIKALRLGADGVLGSGCHGADCHYQTGNYFARWRLSITKRFLEYAGVEPERLQVSWVSASEDGESAEVVGDMTGR